MDTASGIETVGTDKGVESDVDTGIEIARDTGAEGDLDTAAARGVNSSSSTGAGADGTNGATPLDGVLIDTPPSGGVNAGEDRGVVGGAANGPIIGPAAGAMLRKAARGGVALRPTTCADAPTALGAALDAVSGIVLGTFDAALGGEGRGRDTDGSADSASGNGVDALSLAVDAPRENAGSTTPEEAGVTEIGRVPPAIVITPPQTEQRARTPVAGTFDGSTRNTE